MEGQLMGDYGHNIAGGRLLGMVGLIYHDFKPAAAVWPTMTRVKLGPHRGKWAVEVAFPSEGRGTAHPWSIVNKLSTRRGYLGMKMVGNCASVGFVISDAQQKDAEKAALGEQKPKRKGS